MVSRNLSVCGFLSINLFLFFSLSCPREKKAISSPDSNASVYVLTIQCLCAYYLVSMCLLLLQCQYTYQLSVYLDLSHSSWVVCSLFLLRLSKTTLLLHLSSSLLFFPFTFFLRILKSLNTCLLFAFFVNCNSQSWTCAAEPPRYWATFLPVCCGALALKVECSSVLSSHLSSHLSICPLLSSVHLSSPLICLYFLSSHLSVEGCIYMFHL